MKTVAEWRARLREALREAQRARQPHAVSVLRDTLAAIDNAEAADLSAAPLAQPGVIAGGVSGLGAGEVARRVLSAEEVAAVIERELHERRDAAATWTRLGRHEEAGVLTAQLEVIAALMDPP